jgi:hypothetical protein
VFFKRAYALFEGGKKRKEGMKRERLEAKVSLSAFTASVGSKERQSKG